MLGMFLGDWTRSCGVPWLEPATKVFVGTSVRKHLSKSWLQWAANGLGSGKIGNLELQVRDRVLTFISAHACLFASSQTLSYLPTLFLAD